MVCRLIEGWESSTSSADYAGKWTVSGTPTISPANGRFGNGIRFFSSSNGVQRVFDNQVTWVAGFAVRISAIPTSALGLWALLDGATTHCGLAIASDTAILYGWRGSVATGLGSSTTALTPGLWAYVEVKATINDTTGSLIVRVNGVTVLNLTNVDTRNAGNLSANTVRIGATTSAGINLDYDDIYICDTTGAVNADFLGDCKVEQLLPTGAGATTAWTPSAGSNYACVDEVPPNGDTDYVSSATAAQTDSYTFGDLTVTGAVKAVQATVQARKDDAGSRSLALVARPGSTDRVGSTQAVGDAFAEYSQVWDTNPDTAAAWSAAEVNASQFGVRLIA